MQADPEIFLECDECGCQFVVALVQMEFFCPSCRKVLSALDGKEPPEELT